MKSKGKGTLSIHFCGDDKKPLKWYFARSSPLITSVSAVADMCDELACRISDCSERTGKLVAQDNPETTVIPTELMTTDKSHRTDENVQGNLLQDHEQKFPNLPYHLQLTKLCSNAGITKTVARRQHFTTFDDAELEKMRGSCREYTLPRSDPLSQVKEWIRREDEDHDTILRR